MLIIFWLFTMLVAEGDFPIKGVVHFIRFRDFFFRRAEEFTLLIEWIPESFWIFDMDE
jgi:hypothetical protein